MKKLNSIHNLVLILFVLLSLFGVSCSTTVLAQSDPKINNSGESCSPAFIKKAQEMIDQYRQSTGTKGIAVAIYDNGKSCILVSGTADSQQTPVTGETMFAMGSVEKVFSTTLLAVSLNENKAKLDDLAANYLVGKNGITVNQGVPFRNITLKELVTHTASLPEQIPNSTQRVGMNLFRDRPIAPDIIPFLNSWQPDHPPGTKYVYSNLGFVLTGFIAVQLGGKSYTKLLAKEITEPLGMSHTGMMCEPTGTGCAIGFSDNNTPAKKEPVGLWTTADDMLHFIEANLGDLKPSSTLADALNKTHEELFRMDDNHAVGMAWEEWHHGDALLISKDGLESGFGSWIGFEPAHQCGVTVLCNGRGKPAAGNLGTKLLKLADSMK